MKRQQKEREDDRRWRRFQRRLEGQRAEADRARNGRMGAASACRRIDPVTGAGIEVLAKTRVDFNLPKVAKGEAERGDKRALDAMARAGRDGAPAMWLADTRAAGERKGISLVKRGLAAVTRSNRFVLKKWVGKTVPPLITWDERGKAEDGQRMIGMAEPPQHRRGDRRPASPAAPQPPGRKQGE